MTRAATTLAVLAALALPPAAGAQATIERTAPVERIVASVAPEEVVLTFSKPVEPRFARVSVTGADGAQQVAGPPRVDENIVAAPLEELAEGWYLVYWRVVAEDGRPSRGAYVFAVGPNPGPAPAFTIPSVEEPASPRLVVTSWLALLAALAAIGLVVCWTLAGSGRTLGRAFAVASGAALVLTLLSVLFATAQFALRSAFDLGALVPLMDDSARGRGVLAFALCFALFVAAGAIALRTGRRPFAVAALAFAAIALALPGILGPEDALSVLAGWLYLAAAAVLLGGLAALLSGVRHASRIVLGALAVFVAAGIAVALLDRPPDGSWDTSYGNTLVAGFALLAALLASGIVLARARTQERVAVAAVALVLAGTLLVSVVAANVARPANTAQREVSARVGPGPVVQTVEEEGYRVELRVDPNRAGVENRFELRITKDETPVTGADVNVAFSMLEMEMGQQDYELPETAPGVYGRAAPALVMVGHWELAFEIDPVAGKPFTVRFVDEATG